jgi:hypothetical protein
MEPGEGVFKNDMRVSASVDKISFDSVFTITTSITPKFRMKGLYGIRTQNVVSLLSPEAIQITDTSTVTYGQGYYLNADFAPDTTFIRQWKFKLPTLFRDSLTIGITYEFFVHADSIYVSQDSLIHGLDTIPGKKWYSVYSQNLEGIYNSFRRSSNVILLPFKE